MSENIIKVEYMLNSKILIVCVPLAWNSVCNIWRINRRLFIFLSQYFACVVIKTQQGEQNPAVGCASIFPLFDA